VYEGEWERNRPSGKGQYAPADSKNAIQSQFTKDGLSRAGITMLPPILPPTHVIH